MPVVPRYERRSMPSAIPAIRDAQLSTRTPPEAFGANQGALLQSLGATGLKLAGVGAEMLAQAHVDRTLTEVRTAMSAADLELSKQTARYRTLSGQDTKDITAQAREAYLRVRDTTIKGMSSQAAKDLFTQRFEENINRHLGLIFEHELAQTRLAEVKSLEASSEDLLTQVVTFASKPDVVEDLRRRLHQNTAALLRGSGATDEEKNLATRRTDSAVYERVINSYLSADPQKAFELYEKHKDKLTDDASVTFKAKFDSVLPEWWGRKMGEEAYAKHGRKDVTAAIDELEKRGGTMEERSIAKQRLLQLVSQDNALKRAQDNETLAAFHREMRTADPKARFAALAALPLDDDFRAEALRAEAISVQRQSEAMQESRYLELYMEALFNKSAFMQRPLALEFPRLGDTRYRALETMQKGLRDGVQDEADKAIKEGIELWEKVDSYRLRPGSSAKDAAEYKLRRDAALKFLIDETKALFNAGGLQDKQKVSALQLAALSISEPGSPSLAAEAQQPLPFEGPAKMAFESLGFKARRWTFVQERNHMLTSDPAEIKVWMTQYGWGLPEEYRGNTPTSLTIDRTGRPIRATFKVNGVGEVWMTFPTREGR